MIYWRGSENPVSEILSEALREAVTRLGSAGAPDPIRDARLLLRWATGLSGAGLAASTDRTLSADERRRFAEAVAARVERRPVSQIVGGREFYGRWFAVSDAVLDPRPESEILVAKALETLPLGGAARILDLGVGSGCLLLSVLAERPAATGLGVDQSSAALAVARKNATALGLGDRAALRDGDWLEDIDEPFDVILCNPPYIAADDIADLAPEVRLWEPMAALSPGADALAVYRRLAPDIEPRLADGGAAFFEVGAGQADAVNALLAGAGLAVDCFADLDGRARVVRARRPRSRV